VTLASLTKPAPATYPLARDGIFWTLQGEGHLRGFQMAFVRLAGCSVGCPQCDTDYRVFERRSPAEIVARLRLVMPSGDRDQWIWITGGEPSDHDLRPLLRALKDAGFSTALATSGVRRVIAPVDWLSVSPHSADPAGFHQRYGNEIKIAEGLNGLDLDEWIAKFPDDQTDFMYRYVQPIWQGDREDPASLERCLAFLRRHPRWALSRQDHKLWRVP
jgi:7-carboxy-7-deazaguanine synthase